MPRSSAAPCLPASCRATLTTLLRWPGILRCLPLARAASSTWHLIRRSCGGGAALGMLRFRHRQARRTASRKAARTSISPMLELKRLLRRRSLARPAPRTPIPQAKSLTSPAPFLPLASPFRWLRKASLAVCLLVAAFLSLAQARCLSRLHLVLQPALPTVAARCRGLRAQPALRPPTTYSRRMTAARRTPLSCPASLAQALETLTRQGSSESELETPPAFTARGATNPV